MNHDILPTSLVQLVRRLREDLLPSSCDSDKDYVFLEDDGAERVVAGAELAQKPSTKMN